MLYLIATPIGNLGDFSRRAVETLQSCDQILCEDTRHSATLLKYYGIEKPLLSYHRFNEKEREQEIIALLETNRNIALLSDAGTPLISDPGLSLVKRCIERKILFTAIPGPCSLIQALVGSGFDTERFQFIGFIPRETQKRQTTLRQALFYRGTSIGFESPERLIATLDDLHRLDPSRPLCVARELTKVYEEWRHGTAETLSAHFRIHEPRGEIVLLISEGEPPQEEIDIDELVALLQELHGLSIKEAVKAAARIKKLPKRTVYSKIHSVEKDKPQR